MTDPRYAQAYLERFPITVITAEASAPPYLRPRIKRPPANPRRRPAWVSEADRAAGRSLLATVIAYEDERKAAVRRGDLPGLREAVRL